MDDEQADQGGGPALTPEQRAMVQASGDLLADVGARMGDCVEQLRTEVGTRIVDPDGGERELGAAHAACISQELAAQIERVHAAEHTLREAAPEIAATEGLTEHFRHHADGLRLMAEAIQGLSGFTLTGRWPGQFD